MFINNYSTILDGSKMWQNLQAPEGKLYTWDESSTYIHNPPFFAKMKIELDVIKNITNHYFI